MRIQKPGYDLYASTTMVLVVIAMYIFSRYGQMSVDPVSFGGSKDSKSLFQGDMAMVLLFTIGIIICERYCNRADTKAINIKHLNDDEEENQYFER